tara:strand:+ start:82 stop:498 length:417 start_codon:yes stop_codon:yes gene_type:complete
MINITPIRAKRTEPIRWMPIFSFSTSEDNRVIRSGETKNIETTSERGRLPSDMKYRYIAITKHIPRSENKRITRAGNLITSRIPLPKNETINMHNIALIATISARGKRSLKSFINASFSGIIDIPKANKNITTGVLFK